MKGTIGLVLLTIGVVLAAAFGSRNGDHHVEYRQASSVVNLVRAEKSKLEDAIKKLNEEGRENTLSEELAHLEKELARARATQEKIGLPQPRERLVDWLSVGGVGWGGGLVLIVAGAVLARQQQVEDNAGTGKGAVARVDFAATLTNTREEIARLQEMIAALEMDVDAPEARALLEHLDAMILTPMVDGRGQLIARHGLAGFATYFGPFSAGERNLNRCWSALTDGHAVVARASLSTADAAFVAALEQYQKVETKTA